MLLYDSKLHRTLSYSCFLSYWLYFHFAFASLADIPAENMSYTICAINVVIKRYVIIRKKKKKHDKIVFLVKTNWHCIKSLIPRSLIDSYAGYNTFYLVDGVLRNHDYIRNEINNPKTSQVNQSI